MSTKKVFFFLFLGILCIVWGYRIYDINKRFPSPEEHGVQAGETFIYQGLEITAIGNKEVYTLEEIENIYGLGDVLPTGSLESIKSSECLYYVCTDIEIFNPSSEEVSFEKGYAPMYWPYEMTASFNGMAYEPYMGFNYEFHQVLKPKEVQNLKLVYQIIDSTKSREDILSETVKIIYSLYPEKEYIELGGVD